MHITRKETFLASEWSGGTTTELRIFPEDSAYGKRDFNYRVSTATVDVKESVFTSLPGIKRHLMVLEGEMTLVHDGRYEKNLKVYDQDSFMGDFRTRSISGLAVVDFNLMVQGSRDGRLIHHACEKNGLIYRPHEHHDKMEMRDFYCVNGPIELSVGNHSIRLFTGDYLKLQQREMLEEITLLGHGDLIEINVWSE
jgi:hypothetical protein